MSESPESVAQAFVRAINRHDPDVLAELMTEDHSFIDTLGNTVRGRDKMRAGWGDYFRMVPDYSIAVEETYGAGPVVVLLGMAQGTYAPGCRLKDESRWQTPAAIRAFIEDGKVAEWRVYADNEPIRRLMARAVR
jgi:uncharacterized protein (TIGR02246 family)